MTENIGIKVSVDEDTQILLTEGILAILQEPREEQTIQIALGVLERVSKIKATISHNCIYVGEKEKETS